MNTINVRRSHANALTIKNKSRVLRNAILINQAVRFINKRTIADVINYAEKAYQKFENLKQDRVFCESLEMLEAFVEGKYRNISKHTYSQLAAIVFGMAVKQGLVYCVDGQFSMEDCIAAFEDIKQALYPERLKYRAWKLEQERPGHWVQCGRILFR